MYLDPGTSGLNEIHFTFFDPSGGELRVPKVPVVIASRGSEAPVAPEVRRFSEGHFIADQDLGPGRWRFQVDSPSPACFEETVRSG